jgi:hypothetical protein
MFLFNNCHHKKIIKNIYYVKNIKIIILKISIYLFLHFFIIK